MVQNTTTLSSVQDISWHNKGGVGTLSLQQLYNKKIRKNNKQDSQTSIVKTLVTSIDPKPSPSSFIFAIYFLAKTLSKNRSIDINQDPSVQLVAANWP